MSTLNIITIIGRDFLQVLNCLESHRMRVSPAPLAWHWRGKEEERQCGGPAACSPSSWWWGPRRRRPPGRGGSRRCRWWRSTWQPGSRCRTPCSGTDHLQPQSHSDSLSYLVNEEGLDGGVHEQDDGGDDADVGRDEVLLPFLPPITGSEGWTELSEVTMGFHLPELLEVCCLRNLYRNMFEEMMTASHT